MSKTPNETNRLDLTACKIMAEIKQRLRISFKTFANTWRVYPIHNSERYRVQTSWLINICPGAIRTDLVYVYINNRPKTRETTRLETTPSRGVRLAGNEFQSYVRLAVSTLFGRLWKITRKLRDPGQRRTIVESAHDKIIVVAFCRFTFQIFVGTKENEKKTKEYYVRRSTAIFTFWS